MTDDRTHLSGEDVERRLGGGADIRVTRVRPRARASRPLVIRDTATILAGAIIAVLAFRLLAAGEGGLGPVSSSAPSEIVTGSDNPDGSGVALATLAPPATVGPVVNPSTQLGASPTPVPVKTLGPATVTVFVKVTNNDGGNDVASNWTISISGAHASPARFSGSAAGTTVVVDPDTSFTITTTPKTPGGYTESRSGVCSGPIGKGYNRTCTISENDRPVS